LRTLGEAASTATSAFGAGAWSSVLLGGVTLAAGRSCTAVAGMQGIGSGLCRECDVGEFDANDTERDA
jgi:hypothetical protein